MKDGSSMILVPQTSSFAFLQHISLRVLLVHLVDFYSEEICLWLCAWHCESWMVNECLCWFDFELEKNDLRFCFFFFWWWKLWKSCGMRRLFWVCIYRGFFGGGLPYFSSGEAVGCMFSGCGWFAILGIIGGAMESKVHMA